MHAKRDSSARYETRPIAKVQRPPSVSVSTIPLACTAEWYSGWG